METISAFATLVLVMDPLGNVPIFLAALKEIPEKRRQVIILRELLIALGVLVIFLLCGRQLLNFLGLTEAAIRISGGIVLFLIAIKMIFPPAAGEAALQNEDEPFIVPLAIPYVAGPSSLATLILIMNGEPSRWPEWLAALLAAWFVTGIILLAASPLAKILRNRGLVAIERLMGMILVILATQLLLNGVAEFVRTLERQTWQPK